MILSSSGIVKTQISSQRLSTLMWGSWSFHLKVCAGLLRFLSIQTWKNCSVALAGTGKSRRNVVQESLWKSNHKYATRGQEMHGAKGIKKYFSNLLQKLTRSQLCSIYKWPLEAWIKVIQCDSVGQLVKTWLPGCPHIFTTKSWAEWLHSDAWEQAACTILVGIEDIEATLLRKSDAHYAKLGPSIFLV